MQVIESVPHNVPFGTETRVKAIRRVVMISVWLWKKTLVKPLHTSTHSQLDCKIQMPASKNLGG